MSDQNSYEQPTKKGDEWHELPQAAQLMRKAVDARMLRCEVALGLLDVRGFDIVAQAGGIGGASYYVSASAAEAWARGSQATRDAVTRSLATALAHRLARVTYLIPEANDA